MVDSPQDRPNDRTQQPERPERDAAPPPGEHPDPPRDEQKPNRPRRRWVRWAIIGGVAAAVIVGLVIGVPWLIEYFHTVSTDDAYVNGHVSMISARVGGQVTAVRVDDNDRVHQGDLLMELDHQPYQVAVNQKKAALETAEANLNAATAQARGQEAAARAGWYSLVSAQEQVRYQIATLHSDLANLRLQQANLDLAEKETNRVRGLVAKDAATREELDQRVAAEEVARQRVADAQETIRKTRAALGLPPNDEDPTEVPENLDQSFSGVQIALSNAAQSLAQIGVPLPLSHLTPDELSRDLTSRGASSDLNQTLDQFVEKAPGVAQARAARDQAQEDLRNAELNLGYTWIYAPIDGQVFRRNVNPGNNAAVGQPLLAVRSLTDLWIDANFKETEIDNLRIGMPVEVRVDAYPHKTFHGRVQGFSAGTGSSIALIPPENATGNFVKIVQRLPVRVAIDPRDMTEDTPLLAGLSCEPKVLFTQTPTGPNAGARLLAPIPPSANPSTPGPSDKPPPPEGAGR